MVALASAFVRMRPEVVKSEYQKAGDDAGKTFGEAAGKGSKAGIDKGLDEARARAAAQGGEAGKKWGDGFYRDSQGKIRDAQGKFVQSSIATGDKAGKGFAGGFNKGSSGIVASLKENLKLGAALFVPVGLGAAVASIGKIGIEYENNLNIFKQVTGATAVEMDKVAAKARALGADITLPGVSAAGAAAAMNELGKAGFTVQEAMDAAQGTLQLARVASISEADAAEIAANAVNAFGIQARDTGFVVDELAAAANSSSISVTEASASFKQAAAVFSGVQGPAIGSKESITELNTAIAILGNNGIKGSDAGTSLKQMLLQLTGPTQGAKDQMTLLAQRAAGASISLEQQNDVLHGSKKVREEALAEIAKMNPAVQAQGDIAYDASGKMRGLKDIIALTAAGTKGMTQEEKNFAITQIFGADASRAVLALLKGGLPVYEQQRQAVLKQGAAAAAAAAQNAGLGGAIDNVKSQFENAAISIYNAVKGPLTSGLNSFAAALPGIFNNIQRVFGFLADHKATVLGVAYAVGVLTAAVKAQAAANAIAAAGGLITFLINFAKATRAAAAGQTLLNLAMAANPIGLVVIAIGALVAAFYLAYKNSETFRNIVSATWAGIKTAVAATVTWIRTVALPFIISAWQGIAAGAVWLWHNVIEPVWHGIQAAVAVAVAVVKVQIAAAIAVFNAIAKVATFLYVNIFQPVFKAIAKVIEVWWLAVQIVFQALKLYLQNVIFPAIRFLYNNVVLPVFSGIRKAIEVWWLAVKIVFQALKIYFEQVLWPAIRFLYNNVVKPVFNAIGSAIRTWYNVVVKPIFSQVRIAFEYLGKGLNAVWTNVIRPMFQALSGFIKDKVAPGFKTGVSAIAAAWDKVKEAAKVPVSFVVNKVINPFIGGLNAAAKVVGIKDRVDPIKGFAAGGKISGAGGFTDNRQAMVAGRGPVQLMGGEFIVNREDTAKALPLLRWVNNGMKGGGEQVSRRLGKPLTNYPGDGSEGWAFADGGLVGWAKDIWGAISNPVDAIKKPFESALERIPGGGMIRNFLAGSGKRLLGGALKWLGGFSGMEGAFPYTGSRAGRVGQAVQFIKAQAGKPYVWASAGPGGYDCSGIVSAAYNILKGRGIYNHTFSTGSLPGSFFNTGNRASPLLAGWSHPGQAPASASVGHMAGQIAGLPFESRGSRGVVVGGAARKVGQFANVGGARLAQGGVVPGVKVFDGGGAWPSGTLGANLSGRTEYVDANRSNTSMSDVVDRLDRVEAAVRHIGTDVATALNSNSRRTLQSARSRGPM